MNSRVVLIYDGDCPFCRKFAELIELKSGIPNVTIKNAREDRSDIASLLQKGFDIDQGAILLKGEEILHGARAINWICSQIERPSDSLLKILTITFISNKRTDLLFPFLIWGRRIILAFKGIPRKIIS